MKERDIWTRAKMPSLNAAMIKIEKRGDHWVLLLRERDDLAPTEFAPFKSLNAAERLKRRLLENRQ